MVHYTNILDRVDHLGGLAETLSSWLATKVNNPVVRKEPISNHPILLGRFTDIIASFQCYTIYDLECATRRALDLASIDTIRHIATHQGEHIRVINRMVEINNACSVVTYSGKANPTSNYNKLIETVATHGERQVAYSLIDKHAIQLANRITELVHTVNTELRRVQAHTRESVLDEITESLQQSLVHPPEEELRRWLKRSEAFENGRVQKALAKLARRTKQHASQRVNSRHTDHIEESIGVQLFGPHGISLTQALGRVEQQFDILDTIRLAHVTPTIGGLLGEFGYAIIDAVDSLYSLLSIRSTLITAYNSAYSIEP